MKTKQLIFTLLSAIFLTVACDSPQQDLSFPALQISRTSESVEMASSTFTVDILSNRPWKVTSDAAWVAVDPDNGKASDKPQTVTVTVQDNSSFTRSAKLVFDIVYESCVLALEQQGTGSPEDLIIYSNDFDREAASQSYGSSKTSWPYLDQFEGWKNETGKGISSLSYSFDKVSARNNSNSNGTYSDYEGSGVNNLLFAADGYLAVKNLSLNGKTDFKLSFGTEKYDNNNKTALFDPSELKVYASTDAQKWVTLSYEYKGTTAGRWNIAECVFSVPAATEKLSLYITSTVASMYRLDDLKLEVSDTPGTVLDFSQGIDITTGGGSTSGGDTGGGDTGGGSEYDKAPQKTVQEFISAADGSTYYKLKGTVSGFYSKYCSFDLTDQTGTIYVYSVSNKDEWSSKIQNGDTVSLAGQYSFYSAKSQHEVVNAVILSSSSSSGSGGGSGSGDGGGTGGSGGGSNDGSTVTWNLGASYQNWSSTSHASYGTGFTATDSGMKVSYYKGKSTTNPITAKDDHIRVYKSSTMAISMTDGSHIKSVKLTCVPDINGTSYCWNLYLTDGSTATSDKSAYTVSWSGDVTEFVANANDGQLRIKKIEVSYK